MQLSKPNLYSSFIQGYKDIYHVKICNLTWNRAIRNIMLSYIKKMMDNFLFIKLLNNTISWSMRYHSVILALFNTIHKDLLRFRCVWNTWKGSSSNSCSTITSINRVYNSNSLIRENEKVSTLLCFFISYIFIIT